MVVIKKDIVFDPAHKLATDIYYPNDTSSATKILIFWHGGGWFRGDKKPLKSLGVDMANAGFMTFIPNYRLAPGDIFPAAHQDCETFVNWLLASDYTDPDDQNNIYQIGASCGGTMALALAGKYGFPTITWSAPVDFSNWFKNHPEVVPSPQAKEELGLEKREEIAKAFYKYFVQTYAGSADQKVLKKLDATSYDYQNLGPLFMLNSVDELTPLSGVLQFIKFLAEQNKSVQLLTLPGHGHAMDYSAEYLDESLDYLRQIAKRR